MVREEGVGVRRRDSPQEGTVVGGNGREQCVSECTGVANEETTQVSGIRQKEDQ